jgi:putative flippase GtrA
MDWLKKLRLRSLGRWWAVGLAFTAGGIGLMYIMVSVLHFSVLAATTFNFEVPMLLRFLINDRWVFGHRRPTWSRLWQFHLASAGGAIVWWIVANLLPRFGVNYLIASLVGTACSVCFSMGTNFLWIWRGRGENTVKPVTEAAGE